MEKHFLKFRKVFTNVACPPLILISNNSELAAKYLSNDFKQSIKTLMLLHFQDYLILGNSKEVFFKIHLKEKKFGVN